MNDVTRGRRLSPLAVLAMKLAAPLPPSLSSLINRLHPADGIEEFVAVTQDLLPHVADEILSEESMEDQIGRFVREFADAYFPLSDDFFNGLWEMGELDYQKVFYRIPIPAMSPGEDDWHYLPSDTLRPHMLLMSLLLHTDYDDEESARGGRTAMFAAAGKLVAGPMLSSLPGAGFTEHFIEWACGGHLSQRFKALWNLQRWWNHETGNVFLDTDEEGTWDMQLDWTRANVNRLTRVYKEAGVINDSIKEMGDWLKADIKRNFTELVEYLLRKEKEYARQNKRSARAVAKAPKRSEAQVRIRV